MFNFEMCISTPTTTDRYLLQTSTSTTTLMFSFTIDPRISENSVLHLSLGNQGSLDCFDTGSFFYMSNPDYFWVDPDYLSVDGSRLEILCMLISTHK